MSLSFSLSEYLENCNNEHRCPHIIAMAFISRDSSTASELAAELSVHKLKLQEEVVEGVGEKEIEKGLGDQEEIERIETNFEDEAEKSPNKRAFDQIIEAQVSNI